jgi:hypothetical protein
MRGKEAGWGAWSLYEPRGQGMSQAGARFRGRALRRGHERGFCLLRSWRRALVPAAVPRGGGEEPILCLRHHAALLGILGRGGDAAKLQNPPSPSLCRRLRPLLGLGGRVREMGTWIMLLEPSSPDPLRSSRSNAVGPHCAGSAASGSEGPKAARRLRSHGREAGRERAPGRAGQAAGA